MAGKDTSSLCRITGFIRDKRGLLCIALFVQVIMKWVGSNGGFLSLITTGKTIWTRKVAKAIISC